MKTTIAKKADADGWKAVKVGTKVIGHVAKIGNNWRARVGKYQHPGFSTQKDAAAKVAEEHG